MDGVHDNISFLLLQFHDDGEHTPALTTPLLMTTAGLCLLSQTPGVETSGAVALFKCLIKQRFFRSCPLQLLDWSEVSPEAKLVVFSTLLAIQRFHCWADGEWTPPGNKLARA